MKAKRTVYHVQPLVSKNHPWGVYLEGVLVKGAATKSEAIDRARMFAKERQPSQVVVHLKNGRIQTEYTYGDDPVRTKG